MAIRFRGAALEWVRAVVDGGAGISAGADGEINSTQRACPQGNGNASGHTLLQAGAPGNLPADKEALKQRYHTLQSELDAIKKKLDDIE